MTLPSSSDDEKQNYPYYILYGYDKLQYRSDSDVIKACDDQISEFIGLIEREKDKSE